MMSIANNLLFIPNLLILKLSNDKNKYSHLGYNNIGDEGATYLANNLNFIPKLKDLNLSNIIYIYIYILGLNEIESGGIQDIARKLNIIPNLERLSLGTIYT